MKKPIERRLEEIADSLEGSAVKLPLALKLRAAGLILELMNRRRRFGLFVILGWQDKWNEYLDHPDSSQDLFHGSSMSIMRKGGGGRRRGVSATVNFDGAILIDRRGSIIHSGVLIEGMRPKMVARKVNPGRFPDLSEQFGFRKKVHTRHLTAIASSYVFKGTTVFTVSEETGLFHIFEAGSIVYRH